MNVLFLKTTITYLSLSISLFLLLTLANLMIYLHFFEKFDATSNSAIVHHCMLPYEMAPASLFIHEKCHLEKGLLSLKMGYKYVHVHVYVCMYICMYVMGEY